MAKTSVAQTDFDKIKTDNAKLLHIISNSIEEKNGHDIICLNLTNVESAISDYFIICHGNSTTQVNAIASHIEKEVKEKKEESPFHTEGKENEEWILLDYFNIVVHIFLDEKRTFYQLEELWADAIPMKL